jgi:hypothetical protein
MRDPGPIAWTIADASDHAAAAARLLAETGEN